MSFKLENLEYQEKAISSVIEVFRGQSKSANQANSLDAIFANISHLSPESIEDNKREILKQNGISEELAKLTQKRDITIEMETGTGKTLVYIQTLYRLYQEYGFTKFIILVPTVPIRAGVLSTLSTFSEQLREKYGFEIPYFEYDSKKLSRLDGFIRDNNPQIMVMTLQSFTSDDRIINQTGRDKSFDGLSYFQALAKCAPIIVMDEPQEGMDTPNATERLTQLSPLITLRYSATHRKDYIYNRLYRLTPYEAYDHRIVKKLEVLSVVASHDEASMRMIVESVEADGMKKPSITMNLWTLTADREYVMKSIRNITEWTDLAKKTLNSVYAGYVIERVYKELSMGFGNSSGGKWKVRFTNGHEITLWEQWDMYRDFFRLQMKWLIWSHFEKKKKLVPLGIKPLSLIFIDKVDNYTQGDGLIRTLFVEEYTRAYESSYGHKPTHEEVAKIQGSYFAKTGKWDYTDSEATMRSNSEIYKVIMEKKEELISMDEPIEFIFSHSALGVGWDNPNVFTIATLNQSQSSARKQQEIGRGLRICVDQTGKRIYDTSETKEWEEINILTVVPNESYKTFSETYQAETLEQYGEWKTPPTRDITKWQSKKQSVRRKDSVYESASFRQFWSRIANKTRYSVAFNESEIKQKAIESLSAIRIQQTGAIIELNRIANMTEQWITTIHGGGTTEILGSIFSALDIVEELSESTSLSYCTVFEIVKWLSNKSEILHNPPKFVQEAAKILRKIELDEMLRALTYEKTGETIPLTELQDSFDTYKKLQPTPERGLYDHAMCDSGIEMDFARDADTASEVVCFLKLPESYKIPTPIGNYSPDFGIVLKRKNLLEWTGEEFYFVIETKGTNDLGDTSALTPDEVMKIQCAQKHFTALGMPTTVRFEAPWRDYASFVANIGV